ncbi:MAG TPA: hypothetical protein DCL54_06145 [Alphaproteobacteria bacterium]|nr:hypothetical protein [Alphaproteobacteria bacterium]
MPDGFRTGISKSMKVYSDWLGKVEDLQAWSSPAIASTPPWGMVPAALAWRKTSPVRSTPGALPYQRPKTPSNLAPGCKLACWEPHTAVAAKSSFRPGSKMILCWARCFLAFHNCWS